MQRAKVKKLLNKAQSELKKDDVSTPKRVSHILNKMRSYVDSDSSSDSSPSSDSSSSSDSSDSSDSSSDVEETPEIDAIEPCISLSKDLNDNLVDSGKEVQESSEVFKETNESSGESGESPSKSTPKRSAEDTSTPIIKKRRFSEKNLVDSGKEVQESSKVVKETNENSEESGESSSNSTPKCSAEDTSTPVIKKRRFSEKLRRHPYLGIDDKMMWAFVMKRMRFEKANGIHYSKGMPAKGIVLWRVFYEKYNEFNGHYENMHSPASLQNRFQRDLFPDMANSPFSWKNKIDYLLHSQYPISEEFRKILEDEGDQLVICDKKGAVVELKPKQQQAAEDA